EIYGAPGAPPNNPIHALGPDEQIPDVSGNLSDQPDQIGRVGGWAELKAYQMWNIRRNQLFCIGRYEKLFKPGGPEEMVLARAGAGYTTLYDSAIANKEFPWPLGWRGYVSDSTFPNWPNAAYGTSMIQGGLDNAQPGDIITYQVNGLSMVAFVTSVTPGVSVNVVDWDQGKFPTATGSGLMFGMGKSSGLGAMNEGRTIWKTSPPIAQSAAMMALTPPSDPHPNQPSCNDPDLGNCVLPGNQWKTVQIFRPSNDLPHQDSRHCITPDPTFSDAIHGLGQQIPIKDANGNVIKTLGPFSLADTYGWPLSPVGPATILQPYTKYFYSALWAGCQNSGYDPPELWASQYLPSGYGGAGAGSRTQTYFSGPAWGDWTGTTGTGSNQIGARQFFMGTVDPKTGADQ
ncbi:MAG: hypothetical protein KGJ06_05635, partial [Pseudomonadota bacterium]|nr:hypothetical protein [Pseudomonadota bacterium]